MIPSSTYKFIGKGLFQLAVIIGAQVGASQIIKRLGHPNEGPSLSTGDIKRLGRYLHALDKIHQKKAPMEASGMLAETLENLLSDVPQFRPELSVFIEELRAASRQGYGDERKTLNERAITLAKTLITGYVSAETGGGEIRSEDAPES